MKRFLLIVFVVLALGTALFVVLKRPADENFWENTENHKEIGSLIESIEPQGVEIVSYQPKYVSAVEYISDTLGDNWELSDYIVIVDISEQTEYIYDKLGNLLTTYRISTGEMGTDREMSESVWRVAEKIGYEVAPLYGSRMMMLERFFGGEWIQTQVALHGTNEPNRIGTPFSLGCVYHNNADIIALFDILSIGDLVVAIE